MRGKVSEALGSLAGRIRKAMDQYGGERSSSPAELAARLAISPPTLERWIRQGRIPVRFEGGTCRYDPHQLETWLATHPLEPTGPDAQGVLDSLVQCIRRGGVHRLGAVHDRDELLRECAVQMPVADSEGLHDRLLEREQLASTGLGRGVAVPHPRSPLAEIGPLPIIGVFFPEEPVAMDAVDGQPVFVLFVVLSPAVKLHLQLLSRLAFCLKNDDFVRFLATRPDEGALLERIETFESALAKGAEER